MLFVFKLYAFLDSEKWSGLLCPIKFQLQEMLRPIKIAGSGCNVEFVPYRRRMPLKIVIEVPANMNMDSQIFKGLGELDLAHR